MGILGPILLASVEIAPVQPSEPDLSKTQFSRLFSDGLGDVSPLGFARRFDFSRSQGGMDQWLAYFLVLFAILQNLTGVLGPGPLPIRRLVDALSL